MPDGNTQTCAEKRNQLHEKKAAVLFIESI